MPGRGNQSAVFAFVADSPSWSDDTSGHMWSDRKLPALLHEAGLAEQDCYFTSLLKCALPSGTDGTAEQASACLGYLLRELSVVQPRVIFITGKLAFQVLMRQPKSVGIGKLRGMIHKTRMPWGEVAVIATWTPGYARHKDSAGQDIISDILTAKGYLAPPRQTNYRWINDPDELIREIDDIIDLYHSKKLLYDRIAVDTETTNLIGKGVKPVPYPPDHNIATIQVCWNPGEAIAIPVIRKDSVFNNSFNIAVLRNQVARLLDTIPVIGHNYKFDESYFNIKLGVKTKRFVLDTMLAHHFRHGGSLPNNLGFMTSRYLGWVSHKRDIEKELDAMPEDDRRYSNLSMPTILNYGCRDVDATLQLGPIVEQSLRSVTYEKFNQQVVYANMLEAYHSRVMFPWRAILNIEERGALVDSGAIPEVARELEERMNAAYSVIADSPPHAVWLLSHTVPNPKYKVFAKVPTYYIECVRCNYNASYTKTGRNPKTITCPQCRADDAKIRRKMVPDPNNFVINHQEPEFIVSPINLKSPDQVSEFFYGAQYLGFEEIEDLGRTTNKVARAALLDMCEKNGMHQHAQILIAIGEYNRASKLYTAYATKLPNYLFVQSADAAVSRAVTQRFEVPTGVNHIHTNYFQDGTVSGRLSTRDPSLHTIPRKSSIKTIFISRFGANGLIVQGDLSQAEVRAFVIETGDDDLRDAFNKGVDPYILMASKTYSVSLDRVSDEQRQDNKSIVLGLLFGRGATAIADQVKKPVKVVQKLIEDFFSGVPKIKAWIESRHTYVERDRCAVSRFGRIRPLVDQIDADDDEMLNHAHNVSVNHPIQGMVGDLCIDSVARIEYRMAAEGLQSVIFNTVHDSTILDVYIPELPTVMRIVHEEMFSKLPTYFPWINVPFSIDIEIGLSWGKGVKSSLKNDVLTLSGDPTTISGVMSRVRRHFGVEVCGADVTAGKDGKSSMKFSCKLSPQVLQCQ